MSEIMINGPRHPSIVTVYEPSQIAGQPEVVIDTFTLNGGESRPYELPSATAAYRFNRLETHAEKRLRELGDMEKNYNKPPGWGMPPDQEPIYGETPVVRDELDVGKKRGAENAKREQQIEKANEAARKRGGDRDPNDPKLAAKAGTQEAIEGGEKGKRKADAGTPSVDAAEQSSDTPKRRGRPAKEKSMSPGKSVGKGKAGSKGKSTEPGRGHSPEKEAERAQREADRRARQEAEKAAEQPQPDTVNGGV